MKKALIFTIIVCAFNYNKIFAQINIIDSLALVDLYNNTDGADWAINTNWLTSAPLSTWFGVGIKNDRVTDLELGVNNLTGKLPITIGDLSALEDLALSSNNLSDTIPSSLGNLTSLKTIALYSNQFTGSIPESLGNLHNLRVLDLYYNQLSGSIPSALGNLSNLEALELYINQLSGSIPSSFGNLSKLFYLDISNNNLSGDIPNSIGNLTNLEFVYLFNNSLTGQIPASFENLKGVKYLHLSANKITGQIPSFLGNLTNLNQLILSNNELNGTVPSTLSNLSNAADGVGISSNKFTYDGIETIAPKMSNLYYAPQGTIELHNDKGFLSIYAGGTLANDTFHWYKNGFFFKTITGDSTLQVTENGQYNVIVTNSIATNLTLYSNTIDISILPINLLSFTALKNKKTILLKWQTTNEINNNYFDIERSSDSRLFISIGTKQALNINVNNYFFTDNLPLDGINYYRLKQVDKDGKHAYSTIQSVDFIKNSPEFSITPNPANNSIKIIVPQSNSASSIIIYNSIGKKVLSEEVEAGIVFKQLNISQLSSDVYNVILVQNGRQIKTKFVKE